MVPVSSNTSLRDRVCLRGGAPPTQVSELSEVVLSATVLRSPRAREVLPYPRTLMEEMTLSSLLLRGALVIILLAANAFFVAAEFALVASRKTRIEEMVRQGDRKAKTVQKALKDLYRQLSAAQLGITVASILLGYVAEETVAVILHGWFEALPQVLSFLARGAIVSVVAVSVITALHVVVGEQTPKAVAITFPEATSRWAAGPLILFSWITRPATNFLNWSSNRLVRLLGVTTSVEELEGIHSPEEIVMLVKEMTKLGQLEQHDVDMIEGVFRFTDKTVHEVMTPRTGVVGIPASCTIAEALDRMADAGRSRFPVFGESLDDVVGILHVKDLVGKLRTDADAAVTSTMRTPLFIPGTREIEDALADFKQHKTHIAIVLGEYGGTDGIVTLEDLIEEVVGEIYDEYDEAEQGATTDEHSITVPGDTRIEDLNTEFGLAIGERHYQTISGFVFGQLGRLPKTGDRVPLPDMTLIVVSMDGRRIETVRIVPASQASQRPP